MKVAVAPLTPDSVAWMVSWSMDPRTSLFVLEHRSISNWITKSHASAQAPCLANPISSFGDYKKMKKYDWVYSLCFIWMTDDELLHTYLYMYVYIYKEAKEERPRIIEKLKKENLNILYTPMFKENIILEGAPYVNLSTIRTRLMQTNKPPTGTMYPIDPRSAQYYSQFRDMFHLSQFKRVLGSLPLVVKLPN